MASANPLSEEFSLESFKQLRHNIMDFSMITGAIGTAVAVAATGGIVGLFDPIIYYLQMYIPDISGLLGIGGFFEAAAGSETLVSDVALSMEGGHAGHGGHVPGMEHIGHGAMEAGHAAHGAAAAAAESACSITEHGGMFADWVASLQADGMYEATQAVAEQTYGGMGQMFEAAGHCAHAPH